MGKPNKNFGSHITQDEMHEDSLIHTNEEQNQNQNVNCKRKKNI